jgi:hypothetical protein
MRRTLLFLSFIALILNAPLLLAQGGHGCEVTVTAPAPGATWTVGQTAQIEWHDNGQCYFSAFTKVELVGKSATGASVALDTMNNVQHDGTHPYTPAESVLGYAAYQFKFWAEGGGGPELRLLPSVVGTSAEFHIQAAVNPLVADPDLLSFFLPEGNGAASKTVYVLSTQGTISWTVSADQAWIVPNPAAGVSAVGAAAVPVSVTVYASGLAPGTYTGSLTFSEVGRAASATVAVELTISTGEGTPDLGVSPKRVRFTHRLGDNEPPQQVILTNTGTAGTPWKAEVSAEWLGVSPTSGYLNAGASVGVTFSIQGSQGVPGSHRTFVHFKGLNNADAFCAVGLNLNTGAAPGPWLPDGTPLQTLPVAANAAGAYGSFWSTDVVVLPVTPAARAAQARYKLRALEGSAAALDLLGEARLQSLLQELDARAAAASPRGTTQFIWGALGQKARTAEATISEMGVPDEQPTLYLDILGQFFEQPGTSSFIQMKGAGAGDVLLASRTYSTDAEENTYGQSVQAPTAQEIIGPAGGTAFVPGLRYVPAGDGSEGWRSNLFITEIAGTATPVTVQLYDVHGNPTGSPASKTLEPFTQWQIPNAVPVLGSTIEWTYAAVTSAGGGQIVVLGSVVDNNSNDPTTINGLVASPGSRATEDLILPAVVRAPGAFGTNWRSDITLLNASGTSQNVKVQYIPMTGSAAGVEEAWIALDPYGMNVTLDVISTLFHKETGLGTLRILGVDGGTFLAYNRIYNLADDGATFGQGTSAYRAGDAVALNDGTLYTLGLERSPKYRTNVGVVETAGANATVLFTVIAPTGEARGYLVNLAPGQWLQADDIIRSKVGFTEDLSNVWVMIDVVEGPGRVVGYGSIVDNDSSDATFIKLEKR